MLVYDISNIIEINKDMMSYTNYPRFHDIEKKLNNAGWSTFDLG